MLIILYSAVAPLLPAERESLAAFWRRREPLRNLKHGGGNQIWSEVDLLLTFYFDNAQIQYLYNIWYSVDNQIEIKKKMSCTNCLFQIHLKSLFAFCCCQHGVLHRHISQPWVLLHLSTLAKAPNTWGWSGSGGQGLVHVLWTISLWIDFRRMVWGFQYQWIVSSSCLPVLRWRASTRILRIPTSTNSKYLFLH